MVHAARTDACACAVGCAGEGLLQGQPLGLEAQLCPAWGCAVHQVPSRHSQAGVAGCPGSSWHCQVLPSSSAVPGISQGTAAAWRGSGHPVSCCCPACCCPPRRGPSPTLTHVCGQTPGRHRPRTTMPGEGALGLGQVTAGDRAALALPRAPAPTRSSLLLFALCPPRAPREQMASGAQEGLPPQPRCVRCCEPPAQRFYPPYQPLPQINMTILKGEDSKTPRRATAWSAGACANRASRAGALGHRPGTHWEPEAGAGACGPVPCMGRSCSCSGGLWAAALRAAAEPKEEQNRTGGSLLCPSPSVR